MATMKDVAARCGVSETTVSHVLNRTRYVAPETCRKVLEAIDKLDFYKNAHARRLAKGHSDFLGLIISDIENPFFPELIKSFESAAAKSGFDILLATTNYDRERTQAVLRKMIENQVSGVAVMTSQMDSALADELIARNVASVFIDSGPVRKLRSNIRLDHDKGTSQAVNYLYNLGHRRFAVITGPQNRPSAIAYRKAMLRALGQSHVEWRSVEGDNTVEGGVAAIRQLLTDGELPTAILCGSDLAAIGAIKGLTEAGARVPGDISVVGADDIYVARLTSPPLTTIRIPRDHLGALAFAALEKMIHSKNARGATYLVQTEMVIRQSTALARDIRDTASSRSASNMRLVKS